MALWLRFVTLLPLLPHYCLYYHYCLPPSLPPYLSLSLFPFPFLRFDKVFVLCLAIVLFNKEICMFHASEGDKVMQLSICTYSCWNPLHLWILCWASAQRNIHASCIWIWCSVTTINLAQGAPCAVIFTSVMYDDGLNGYAELLL